MHLSGGDPGTLEAEARGIGFECLELDCYGAASFHRTRMPPGDPFDRTLAHLALERDLVLLSKDPFFKKLKSRGLQTIW